MRSPSCPVVTAASRKAATQWTGWLYLLVVMTDSDRLTVSLKVGRTDGSAWRDQYNQGRLRRANVKQHECLQSAWEMGLLQ